MLLSGALAGMKRIQGTRAVTTPQVFIDEKEAVAARAAKQLSVLMSTSGFNPVTLRVGLNQEDC
jgi:hypothetical protein